MPGRNGPPAGGQADAHAEEPVHERPRSPVLGGVRDEPGGLRDHEQVLVGVPDGHGRLLGDERLLGGEIDLEPLAALEPERLRDARDRPP